jgi:hypothetical protein
MGLRGPFARWRMERQALEQLQEALKSINQATRTVDAAAKNALTSSKEAARAAAEAASAAATSTRAATDLTKAARNTLDGRETPVWRVVRLWAYVAMGLIAAVIATRIGSSAFGNPRSLSADSGLVQIAVSTGAPDHPKAFNPVAPAEIAITAAYDQRFNTMSYDISVPAQFAGRKLFLLLEASAMIARPIQLDVDAELQHHYADCKFKELARDRTYSDPCEVITVQLPRQAQDSSAPKSCADAGGSSISFGSENGRASSEASKAIKISVAGHSRALADLDMFHQVLRLPSLRGGRAAVREWNGIRLGTWVRTTELRACREATVANDVEVGDIDRAADRTAGNTYHWDDPDAVFPINVVIHDRAAERWGNVCVIAAGAAAALAIGFFPLAYASTGSWRQRRSRQDRSPAP